MRTITARGTFAFLLIFLSASIASAQQKRPMTFLDMQHMKQASGPSISRDGKWVLYTISHPDWKEAKRQTDIYVVSAADGVASTRQLTFTKEKNETQPRWAPAGGFFAFLSNRDAPSTSATQNQLYVMRPDGSEVTHLADARPFGALDWIP